MVGLYFGNPQLGMAIGGMIGGAVDPDQIQGNKIGDVPAQRSQSGGAQCVILGTSLAGNCTVMSQGPDMIVKEKTDPGKGSGTEVVNEVLYRDFTIRVCRSSRAEDCEVKAFVAVYMAGNLVYDVRPNSKLTAADNAKWKKDYEFYYGGPDQGTDPTEESYIGVGSVSAHRQIARIVGKRINLTDYGNMIPPFEVIVSQCPVEPPNHILITGRAKGGSDHVFAAAKAQSVPEYTGLEVASGADIVGGTPAWYQGTWVVVDKENARYSTDNRKTWQAGSIDSDFVFGQLVGGTAGWLTVIPEKGHSPSAYVASPVKPLAFERTSVASQLVGGLPGDASGAPYTFMCEGKYFLSTARTLYRADKPEGPYVAIWDGYKEAESGRDPNGASIIGWYDITPFENHYYAVIEWHFDLGSQRLQIIRSTDIDDWSTFDVIVDVASGASHSPAQLCLGYDFGPDEDQSGLVCYNNDGTLWTSENSWSAPIATGLVGPGMSAESGVIIAGGRRIAFTDKLFHCIGTTDTAITFDPETLAVGGPYELPIGQTVGIVASAAYAPAGGGMVVPDAPGNYYDPVTGALLSPSQDEAQMCGTTLGNVVRWLCHRGQLVDAEIDVGELEDIPVRGITLQTTGSCKSELEPIRMAHFFDPADFDSALRFRLRGAEDVDMVIDSATLALTDDEEEENRLIGQDVEYPKRHHLEYLSYDLDYIRTTTTAERTSIDPSVVGETQASINEVFTTQEGKYICAIQHKQQWMTREGGRKFGSGLELIQLVGASLIEMDGRRGRIDSYSIDLFSIWFDSVPYDRASAMRARVVAAEAVPPSPPASQVRGPTISAVMNAPVVDDANDKAGIIWAGCGPMRGWRGAQLQASRDGGATWENGPIIDGPAVMGELTATLPAASRYVQDNTNTLSVTLYRTDASIDSTDFQGLMAERNVWAIEYPDGTVEIGQAQTGIEIADRQWELTGLMRGRQDTVAGEHLVGAKFVLLNDAVRFVAIRPDDVGKTLKFRAVSLGTDPDAAEVQDVTFTTIESLREWQPYNIEVTPDGLGGYCVAWIGRARLGTSRTPVHSQWFEGYRVTFSIGSVVHEVDTTEQAICVAAATMLEAFGPSHGIPAITVRARSRVATNDDDFDSPPGGPATDPFPSYPATIIGEPGDMYEGEGVLDYLGPANNPPFQAYGGKLEEFFTGYIARNVTCQSSAPGSGIMVGIPLTAETENADTTLWPSGPDVIGGPFTITDSVAALPMPAFAMMNELAPWGDKKLVTLVTSTPRTTKRIGSSGLGGLRSRAGFSTGERRCEFIVDNMPAGGRVAIGALAAGVDAHLAPGTGGTFAHIVTANGTFAVEVDAATGDVEVFELGVGLVASGTLPLTYAHDGKYRFAWAANDAQHLAAGATVHTNQGNESWAITPTGAFGGVPNEAHVIPCGFDAEVGAANGYWPQGTQSLTLASAGGFSGTSVIYAYSEFAKSTGAWRIGMAAGSAARIGLCKAGHTGLLGQGGDSFGMSYDFSVIGSTMIVFDTTWAGQIRIPHPFYTMDRKIIFVCDFDAHTVEVWGKPQFSDYILLTVLTSLPSGAWVPAGNHAVELINGASEIPGATDWSVTKTP